MESTSTDAALASTPSSSSTPPSSSSIAKVFLAAIMDQLQLMRVDFGSCLDHFSDEMCQINTKIGHIARRQSRLGGFAPSPTPEPTEESFLDGGDSDDNDASCCETDDEKASSH